VLSATSAVAVEASAGGSADVAADVAAAFLAGFAEGLGEGLEEGLAPFARSFWASITRVGWSSPFGVSSGSSKMDRPWSLMMRTSSRNSMWTQSGRCVETSSTRWDVAL
jgi:hypothetical protein